ncbi:hypothetical protein K503DRAFT_772980 [Rhizopogon vinicolor AM-OR11-026]|uniref:Uncharacterized protein n=1 Tax=Rhizopogon vinicolor AM-OR11-026 TaxID=1314800 RepID=A0A1B7MTK3_9AGAM|nr:hypothetical protein K503DRAFT_772980 [Rhizopogon vinicolor AM-OR11-026]
MDDDRSRIQRIPIPEFGSDHEGSHAKLQSQSRAPRLDAHPSQGGFLFTTPNPDDLMELELEDEENTSEAPRSRLGLMGFPVGSPLQLRATI